jgi:hypothetical protein
MMGGALKKWRAMLAFEMVPTLKGPLPWAALAGLILFETWLRFLMSGSFSFNGKVVGQLDRLVFVAAFGYSGIPFLATLLTLSLCLDRTGAHYLRNNDLLALSRGVGRMSFYLAKIAGVLVPVLVYSLAALGIFWLELYRNAGVNLYRIFLLIFPLALGLACLVSIYFLMRNFLGNFMIFFLWLLLLPVIYVSNLWHYYAGVLREGVPQAPFLGFLPQFGGIHAHSLGMIHDFYRRDGTWHALAGGGVWTVLALAAGLWVFTKKRL